MADKKEIGKLFRERLKDFEQAPTKTTWRDIESELNADSSSNRFSWINTAYVGMSLILLIGIIAYFSVMSSSSTNPVVHLDESESCEQNTRIDSNQFVIPNKIPQTKNQKNGTGTISFDSSTSSTVDNKIERNQELISAKNSVSNSANNQKKKTPNSVYQKRQITPKYEYIGEEEIGQNKSQSNATAVNIDSHAPSKNSHNQSAIKPNNFHTKDTLTDKNGQNVAMITSEEKVDSISKNINITNVDEISPISTVKDSIQLLKKETDSLVADQVKKQPSFLNNLNVGAHLIPVYPILAKNNSLMGAPLSDFSEKSRISLGFGAYVSSKFSDKWSASIGVNLISLKSETEKFRYSDSLTSRLSDNGARLFFEENPNDKDIKIVQKIKYYEIPVDFRYQFSDNKLSPIAIGGFSFMYFKESQVEIRSNSQIIGRGDQKNVLKGNINLHLGLGLRYKITDNFYFNSTATFSHFLFDVLNSERYRPTYLSVQTGFSFKF